MVINYKTCLVYSPGGHSIELKKSIKGIKFKNSYDVTFNSGKVYKNKVYFITHPRKKIIRFVVNFFESFLILLKERPKIIISTGADVAVATLILGKIFFKSKTIFIESVGNYDKPTLSGRLCYNFCDLFIIQFTKLKKIYPKSILANSII